MNSTLSHSTLGTELEEAATGLAYISESDYPFHFFTLPAEGKDDLTPEGFLVRLGVSSQFIQKTGLAVDQLIEERPLVGCFQGDGEIEKKKFRALEQLLRRRLRGVKVLRVGQVEIRCYIAGFDEHGNIAGLVTTSIET